MLNRGGFANPDVLVLERDAAPALVVKDYGSRSLPVRLLLAPWLVRHEHAMLERLEGLPGVPAPAGRIGRLALAMERIEGTPLTRRRYREALPPGFFAALEGILEGLARRGVVYLDLSSPTNVLATPSGAPALVDMASAVALPLPRCLVQRLEARALAKLRRRFERRAAGSAVVPAAPAPSQLDLGRVRFCFRDRGPSRDPVPVLLLHDAGLTGAFFTPILERAADFDRRAIAPDLPGFGDTRAPRGSLSPRVMARWLRRLLGTLRIARVDAVGFGWGGLVARALAVGAPDRVRALATYDTPGERLTGELLSRWQNARSDPAALRQRIAASLPKPLPDPIRAELEARARALPEALLRRVYRGLPVRAGRRAEPALRIAQPTQPWLAEPTSASVEPLLEDPERLFVALSRLTGPSA